MGEFHVEHGKFQVTDCNNQLVVLKQNTTRFVLTYPCSKHSEL